jgi:peptidoglycan/LPS O-acetylase OafA/YrhL
MLRAVAALLVVAFHTETIFAERTGRDPFGGLFANGGHGVDLFFVLSGFVIAFVHRDDWGSPHRLGIYLFNRAARIYPGVWIVSALAIALLLAGSRLGVPIGLHGADRPHRLDPWSIATSVLLLPQTDVPLVNVTWTLKCEMFFYLVFALAILRRWCLGLLLLWQAATLVCALLGIDFAASWADSWARDYFAPTSLEFGIGMALAWRPTRPAPHWAGASLLLGTVIFVGGAPIQTYVTKSAPLPDLAIYGLGSFLIVGGAVRLEQSGRRIGWPLVSLGDASYSIYLVHFAVVTLVSGIVARLGVVPNVVVCLAVGAAGVGAGVLFHRCVDRPIQLALRRARPDVLRLVPAMGRVGLHPCRSRP